MAIVNMILLFVSATSCVAVSPSPSPCTVSSYSNNNSDVTVPMLPANQVVNIKNIKDLLSESNCNGFTKLSSSDKESGNKRISQLQSQDTNREGYKMYTGPFLQYYMKCHIKELNLTLDLCTRIFTFMTCVGWKVDEIFPWLKGLHQFHECSPNIDSWLEKWLEKGEFLEHMNWSALQKDYNFNMYEIMDQIVDGLWDGIDVPNRLRMFLDVFQLNDSNYCDSIQVVYFFEIFTQDNFPNYWGRVENHVRYLCTDPDVCKWTRMNLAEIIKNKNEIKKIPITDMYNFLSRACHMWPLPGNENKWTFVDYMTIYTSFYDKLRPLFMKIIASRISDGLTLLQIQQFITDTPDLFKSGCPDVLGNKSRSLATNYMVLAVRGRLYDCKKLSTIIELLEKYILVSNMSGEVFTTFMSVALELQHVTIFDFVKAMQSFVDSADVRKRVNNPLREVRREILA